MMPSDSWPEQAIAWLTPVVCFLYGIEPPPPVLTPWEWVNSYLDQLTPHGSLCWQFIVWLQPVENFFTGIGPTIPLEMVLERLFLACLLARAYFVVCFHMSMHMFRLAA
jgi:hypothetical protein